MHEQKNNAGIISEISGLQLSVITVTRNDVVRLEKTIQSLRPIYGDPRFEHIVIDALSTDRTRALVEGVGVFENMVFISERDNGIYDGMNKGVRRARGRYLLFLNAGDCLNVCPDALAQFLFSLGTDVAAQILCFPVRIQFSDYSIRLEPQTKVGHKMPTTHQGMLFSADFIKAVEYDTRYRIAADYNLVLKANGRLIENAQFEEVLTLLEADGAASAHPLLSYGEYVRAISENRSGLQRIFMLIRVLSRGLVVAAVKKILPRDTFGKLRRLVS